MIKAIEIENFKGIGERQRVEFAPITLLFGPNSAGKSTVIQALTYAYEVISGENPDLDVTSKGGESIHLGGFRNFVHKRDLRKSISMRFELPFAPVVPMWGIDYEEVYDLNPDSEFDIFKVFFGAFSLDFSIAWNHFLAAPVVTDFRVGLNGVWIAEAVSVDGSDRMKISRVNWIHPKFLWSWKELGPRLEDINHRRGKADKPLLEARVFEFDAYAPGFTEEVFDICLEAQRPQFELMVNGAPVTLQDLDPNEALALSRFALMCEKAVGRDFCDGLMGSANLSMVRPFGINTWETGRLDPLEFDEQEWPGFDPSDEEHICVREALGHLILMPVHLLSLDLSQMIRVGPVRSLSDAHSNPEKLPPGWIEHYKGWPEGSGAWGYLQYADQETIDYVNSWLADENRLATGYSIRHAGDSEGDSERAKECDLVLVETSSKSEMALSDVGVGMSQIIPVVVAACAASFSIVCVEQPELHLHPRSQVGLGDLFLGNFLPRRGFAGVGALGGCGQCIIESHSEHLLLRMMRRLRETASGTLKEELLAVTPPEISIQFVERLEGRTVFRAIPLNERGELVKAWPGGFFEEGLEELL